MFMTKGLKRGLKGLLCTALAAATALTGVKLPAPGGQGRSSVAVAEAASTTSRVPMWAYMKNGSGRLTTYTANTLKKSTGYIVPGDYCKISAFYSNGSVKVTYPTSKGSKTAYAAMSGFMTSTGFSTSTRTLGKRLTAYRRSTGSSTIGTVYATDKVIVVGQSNGRTQVQYPCSGGYKLGWVAGSYSAGSSGTSSVKSSNSSSYSPVVYNGSQSEIEALCFDARYYADTYPDLKAAYGYDSARLLNHWKTWGIREGRGASPILDLKYYMENNEDLRKFYGSKNYAGGYQHFLEHGYAEFRASSQYFDGDYYRRNNSDLKSFDNKFLLRHYLVHGIQENRYANKVRYITSGGSTVQRNIYNQAMASMGTKGAVYQRWAGLSYSDPYCVAYATYIANQAMLQAGYSQAKALSIVPKQTSTAKMAAWYAQRGRCHSYAAWYNKSRGVRIGKNTTINGYTPQVGDLVMIDNNGNISTGPEHTGLVISVSSNSITLAEGNTGAGTNATRVVKTHKYYKGSSYWYRSDDSRAKIVGFCTPAY